MVSQRREGIARKAFKDWLNDVNTIAQISSLEGHQDLAAETTLKATVMVDKFVLQTFPFISFPEQCKLASALRQQADSLLSYSCQPAYVEQSYSFLSKWKGFLVSALESRAKKRKLLEKTNKELIEDLEHTENELANMQVHEQQTEQADEEHKLLAKLEQLQRQVSCTEPGVGNLISENSKSLQKKLGEGQCAIDLYRYTTPGEQRSKYGVFIIQPQSIKFKELGDTKEVDGKIYALRNSILSETPYLLASTRDAAPSAIQPKQKSLDTASSTQTILRDFVPKGTKRLWFCPDGEFSLLPSSVLFSPQIRVTCVDRLADLSIKDAENNNSPNVMIVGNVDFAGQFPALQFFEERG